MPLKIKKQVGVGPLKTSGCYIVICPNISHPGEEITCQRVIWQDKATMDNIASRDRFRLSIQTLDEVPSVFVIPVTEKVIIKEAVPAKDGKAAVPAEIQENNIVPSNNNASTVRDKFLLWIDEQCKAQLLDKNTSWNDADIEIVDIV